MDPIIVQQPTSPGPTNTYGSHSEIKLFHYFMHTIIIIQDKKLVSTNEMYFCSENEVVKSLLKVTIFLLYQG